MNKPEDPISAMAEAAVGQHELYTTWISAGFTPEQAMELLKTFMTEVIRGTWRS